jgi:hypothetical protein
MIVEILADVAAKLGGNDFRGLAVEAVDPEIDFVSGVQDSNFGFFRGRLAFVGFFLEKIGDGNG